MNEHELCCGTVADKVKLCAEIEQRDLIIAAQQRRIEELLKALDDVAEQAERLTAIPYTKTRAEFMKSWGVDGMSADKKRLVNAAWDRAEWFFNQQAALLKEEWNAHEVPTMSVIGLRRHADEIRNRAQKTANGSNP